MYKVHIWGFWGPEATKKRLMTTKEVGMCQAGNFFSLHLFWFGSPKAPGVHFIHIGIIWKVRDVEIGYLFKKIIEKNNF